MTFFWIEKRIVIGLTHMTEFETNIVIESLVSLTILELVIFIMYIVYFRWDLWNLTRGWECRFWGEMINQCSEVDILSKLMIII